MRRGFPVRWADMIGNLSSQSNAQLQNVCGVLNVRTTCPLRQMVSFPAIDDDVSGWRYRYKPSGRAAIVGEFDRLDTRLIELSSHDKLSAARRDDVDSVFAVDVHARDRCLRNCDAGVDGDDKE